MKEMREQEIKRVMGNLQCPEGYKCIDTDETEACRTERYGLESFLLCLEPHAPECPFSISYGGRNLCKCPLRVYLHKSREDPGKK